ncbi:MAG: PilZ domain-containing protein [Gammaproteobacteria bacterium]|nr:PilZ domain-containing protein [Gammaproteobacteria bacterium]
MNKRWNKRKPASVDLVISYPAFGLLRGKAVNISHDGMFIETAAISLCNYSNIDLTLSLPELFESPINIQATIIHNTDNGIGVMFRNKEDNSTIVNTLHQYATSQIHQQAV